MHACALLSIMYICFRSSSTSGHRRWSEKDRTSLSCLKECFQSYVLPYSSSGSHHLSFFHTGKPSLIATTRRKIFFYVDDCRESNLSRVSPPSFPPFSAAIGCLAKAPGQCARLIFTTVPKSASASPTTWGPGGINLSLADTEKRKNRTSFMAIHHDLRAKNKGGAQNWKGVHVMDYSKLKGFYWCCMCSDTSQTRKVTRVKEKK